MRRIRVLLPLLVLPATLASQQAATSRAADLVTLAREQIRANRADSALTLLNVAADSATGGAVGDRVQAYVLLGVLEYIAHRDSSATALAFRHALQLDPGFQAGGLAEVDSALIRILTAERNALPPDTVPARAAAPAPQGTAGGSPSDVAHECVRRCRGGEIKPELIDRPRFTNQVLDAVRALHFRPAMLGGAPVRAEVEMRFDFRASGTNYVDYTITGP